MPTTQDCEESAKEPRPRVTVFAPHPLLTVTLEREGAGREQVHFHPGGQGVWVTRMVACLGAEPVFCGFLGGESGVLLGGLLLGLGGAQHLVGTTAASGCYVTDRRSGERQLLTCTLSDPSSRHEVDELFYELFLITRAEATVRIGASAGAAKLPASWTGQRLPRGRRATGGQRWARSARGAAGVTDSPCRIACGA